MLKLISVWAMTVLLYGCFEGDTGNKKNTNNRNGQNTPTPTPDPIPSPPPSPGEPTPKCEVVCDTSNTLFQQTDDYGYMSFVNFGFRGIGRCRGHAIVTQNLSKLAFFDKSDSSCVGSSYDDQCVSNALEAIKNILRYQAQKIVGFPDILSLSSHPKIEAYLKMRVRSISHKYSARSVRPVDPRHDNVYLNTFDEIARRIEMKHEPYIGIKGGTVGDHALLAYDFKRTQYGETLCVRDSNYIPPQGLECKSIVYHQDGEIYYKRADREATKLFIFNLMTDEDLRVQKYQVAQKNYCIEVNSKLGLCAL